MVKASKIIDVQTPDKTVPAATGRPVIVSNRPIMANDPMMVADQAETSESTQVTVTRSAKTITPLHDATEGPETTPEAEPETKAMNVEAAEASSQQTPGVPSPELAAAAATTDQATPEAKITEPARDAAAEATATEAEVDSAREARQAEIEQLIASGTYAVPINAVQRKRSRLYVLIFCLLTVVLALALLDALCDAGIVTVPSAVPHTHFFSTAQ